MDVTTAAAAAIVVAVEAVVVVDGAFGLMQTDSLLPAGSGGGILTVNEHRGNDTK